MTFLSLRCLHHGSTQAGIYLSFLKSYLASLFRISEKTHISQMLRQKKLQPSPPLKVVYSRRILFHYLSLSCLQEDSLSPREQELKDLKESLQDTQPVGVLVDCCRTMDQVSIDINAACIFIAEYDYKAAVCVFQFATRLNLV